MGFVAEETWSALLIIIFIILIAILFLSCSASGNEAASEDDETPYVEIFRTDTGKGHDDTYMMNLILYLGSKGYGQPMIPLPLAWRQQRSKPMP